MSQLVDRRISTRWLLYLVIAGAVAIALLAAYMLEAPNASADPTTVSVTVCLESSTGGPIGGGLAQYSYSGLNRVGSGSTDGTTGCVTGQVATSASSIRMDFQGEAQTMAFSPSTTTYTFQTSKVTLLNTQRLCYVGNAGSAACWGFTNGMELLPGPYTFKNWSDFGNPFNITVGNTNFTGGVLRLLDHNGAGLAGGTASVYCSGWSALPGTTDSNGNLVFQVPGSCNTNGFSLQMNYLGTYTQQGRTQLNADDFTFQTVGVTVKLEDADGNPLDPGSASYYAGGWRTFGAGTTSGGLVTQEMLPGSWAFSMSYNHTLQQLNNVVISAPTTNVVFQTGRLTVYYSGSLGWNNGEPYAFTKPSMEFLPGSIQLDPDNCRTSQITIAAGDHLVKSVVVATLKDGNTPLSGGEASAYVQGSWQTVGTTGYYGACAAFDGQLGNTSVAMVYNGTRQQIQQNQPTNSIYAFATAKNVVVELENSSGQLIDTGDASYYAGGWHDLGNTSGGKISATILPGTYTFAMTYNGTRQQFSQTITSAGPNNVVFQTTDVTVQLLRSNNLPPSSGSGTASYYAGGWNVIGDTDSSGNVSVQMLPGSYSFAMAYNGMREQLNGQAVSGASATVTFKMVAVEIQLLDHTGNRIQTPDATASYYADGWHTIGTMDAGVIYPQMLPGNYSFAMTYLGTREQINGASTSSAVNFQTGEVGSASGMATAYYAGGWQPFTNNMELLPGTYTFSFSDGFPNTQYTLSGNTTNTIH